MRLVPTAALAAVLGLAGCSSVYEVPEEPALTRSLTAPGAQVDTQLAASMFSEYRSASRLGPLAIDPVLQRMALEQAQAMARYQKVGHDAGAGPLDARARRAGYEYAEIAENVAGGYHSLAEAFSGWRDSSDHRRNTLKPGVTHMGIAIAQAPNSKYKVYWAMIVAKPYTPPVASAPMPVPPPAR